MTEEYLEKLESILLFLQTRENTTNEELESLAAPYWLNIKQYLLEKKALMSPNGGGVFWVRKKFISKSLEDIRIQKRLNAEKKDEEKSKERRSFWRDVLCLAIGAILTVVAQEGWKLLTNNFFDESSDNKTNQSSKHPKEKTSDDRHGVLDSIQLVKNSI